MSEDYKKRARALGEKRKEKANFTISEGTTVFRLGPTPAGKTSPAIFEEYQVHEKVGPKKKFLRCGHPPGWQKGDDDTEDWLCDVHIPKMRKKKKMSRVDALQPVTKLVVQASKVTEDDDGKPSYGAFKPWTPSPKVASTLLSSILGNKKRDYVDRKRGYNLNIERTGTTQFDTRYGPIEPDDEPSVVPKALIEAIQPFDSIRGVPKYNKKAQQAAIAGQEFDWREAENDSESDSESSESDSSEEAESGVEDVFESESKDKKKKGKNKMAVKSTKKNKKAAVKESESAEPESSESASESGSESESSSSESESASKDKKAKGKDKKKDKKKKASESSSGSESGSESESSESGSESGSESASESESESEEKKAPKKAAKKAVAKKKAKKK